MLGSGLRRNKGQLGIFVFLMIFILGGCGGLKPQEVSTVAGISVARRVNSRITPIPDINLLGSTVESDSQPIPEEVSNLPADVPSDSQNPTIAPVEQATQTPTLVPTFPPVSTQEASQNTLEPQSTKSEVSVCSPENNRNFETEVIQLINQERIKEGLQPLTEQSQLTQAARMHSEDMACNQFFSHISPSNGDVEQRVNIQGYTFSAIGENIGAGYGTPASIVQAWLNSTGHRANILNATFTQVGVGYILEEGSISLDHWTLLVATP